MYRIAVIQNGIEMQHSGYVDAIPMYKKFGSIGREKAEFTRFSGVNIQELFNQGEKYILDFDAIILGTNATSDDDVYNVLLEESCRKLLEEFISKGKGVLICSQKKYKSKIENDLKPEYKVTFDAKSDDFMRILDDTGKGELFYSVSEEKPLQLSKKRISSILPDRYEYTVVERPLEESSKDGYAMLIDEDRTTLNQRCIFSLPHNITDVLIDNHCKNNSFQRHYYRDMILPIHDSAYQQVIIDKKGADMRNLLMVAVPQKNERIVISTMALDWAGHEELLENIINYLTRGIPHTAFIHKGNYDNGEMKILTLDAELSKIGNIEYCTIDDYMINVSWHSLVIFSPDFTEKEVSETWKIIKEKNKFAKVYHYRNVEDELVLVKYSNNTYIEQQKMDVLAWLNSKRGRRLWDNSFWKTFDVARLLYTIRDDCCPSIIAQIVDAIVDKDDKNKAHYKDNGSYDGVLAPTCGVMEILKWAENKYYYNKTKKYLVEKYREEHSTRNKMFIIRSFYRTGDTELKSLLNDFSFENLSIMDDIIDIDLCLYAEIAIILQKHFIGGICDNKEIIIKTISALLARQMPNGKWDNLSNTATILIFLLQNMEDLNIVLEGYPNLQNQIKERIDRGITAIKTAYAPKYFNWENNIVTTANSLLALYLYDRSSGYKSKDFLKNFVDEGIVAANYNALNLSLHTLDVTIDDLTNNTNKLVKTEEQLVEAKQHSKKLSRRLYLTGMVAGFSLTCLLSVFIQLALNVPNELADILSELFMWIPVAIGTIIPAMIFFINKKINNIDEERGIQRPKKKNKNNKRGK